MQTAIDGDILLYEIGFAAEAFQRKKADELGEALLDSPPWETVERSIHERINNIVVETASTDPIFLFTGKGNFRNTIAVTQKYKDREGKKPFHYTNIKLYIQSVWPSLQVDGLEADDLLGILLTENPDRYICCSRDKDLKQIPGWHYGWEVHNQPSFGPELIGEFGYIMLSSKRDKLIGTGAMFHHAQMLMGDTTDTIPGIPKHGPVAAFNLLNTCTTIDELEQAVRVAYNSFYGDAGDDRMVETARLTYMSRKRDGDFVELYSPSFRETEWINYRTGAFKGTTY